MVTTSATVSSVFFGGGGAKGGLLVVTDTLHFSRAVRHVCRKRSRRTSAGVRLNYSNSAVTKTRLYENWRWQGGGITSDFVFCILANIWC